MYSIPMQIIEARTPFIFTFYVTCMFYEVFMRRDIQYLSLLVIN